MKEYKPKPCHDTYKYCFLCDDRNICKGYLKHIDLRTDEDINIECITMFIDIENGNIE